MPPACLWLFPSELLTLAAEVEASRLDGHDARAELCRQLTAFRAKWVQRWAEEWAE